MEYLSLLGHRLIARNYLSPDRRTEIDLITFHEGVVHFIEVKAWGEGPVHPLETQTTFRAHRVRRAARMFFAERRSLIKDFVPLRKLCRQEDCLPRASFDLLWVRGDGWEFFEGIF